MEPIPERDWKRLRAKFDDALEAACARILAGAVPLTGPVPGQSHKAFLDLYEYLVRKNHEVSVLFDDPKRSNAVQKLAAWWAAGLLTEAELGELSEETQERVRRLAQEIAPEPRGGRCEGRGPRRW
jgi:hypothetical protein